MVRADTLRLVYPRLPERSPNIAAASLALLALRGNTGVRVLELSSSLESFRPVERIPVSRGDAFEAAGRRWETIWPPERLPTGMQRSLSAAVAATEDLARDLDAAGYPALRRNLEEAYERPFPGGEDYADTTADRDHLDDSQPHAPDPEWALEHEPDEQLEASESVETATHGRVDDLEVVPEGFRKTFREVAKRVAAANNNLSLVFHDNQRHLAVFGDIQGSVLRMVVRDMDSRYHVILAPHHGTVPVPVGFPASQLCVSQGGSSHLPRWGNHRDSHGQLRACVNTAQIGTISIS
jgi:hypothetical protein